MDIKRQERAPIYEALEEFKKKRVVLLDVPGHKRERQGKSRAGASARRKVCRA